MNYGDKKYKAVHSDCPLYNTKIWGDYKISAGSKGFTWIFLLTSTFHLQIVTHKEPCSPYPAWASCYLSVHRKMKKVWRNVATSNSDFKKNTGLQYSAAYYGPLTVKDMHFAELIQSLLHKKLNFWSTNKILKWIMFTSRRFLALKDHKHSSFLDDQTVAQHVSVCTHVHTLWG